MRIGYLLILIFFIQLIEMRIGIILFDYRFSPAGGIIKENACCEHSGQSSRVFHLAAVPPLVRSFTAAPGS